jgi:hypothetical protein
VHALTFDLKVCIEGFPPPETKSNNVLTDLEAKELNIITPIKP